MISRRQILAASGGGLVAGAALAIPAAHGGARRGGEVGIALFLFDRSLRGASAAASGAIGAADVSLAGFRGDVGVPWLELIEPLWRHGAQPIAGITQGSALFCLEQLGRKHRIGCTMRLALPRGGAGRLDAAARTLIEAAAHRGEARRRQPGETAHGPVAWLLQPIARNQG